MKMFKKAEQRGNLTDLQYSTLTTVNFKTIFLTLPPIDV